MGETPLGETRLALQTLAGGTITPDVVKRLAHFLMISPQYHLA
jgi:hypothetical protein